jgi:hypothetical protein
LVIVRDMHARGAPFPDVFFIQEGTPVGEAVRNIADAAEIERPSSCARLSDPPRRRPKPPPRDRCIA